MATHVTIEVEAETMEEAREQLKSRTPRFLALLSEQLISDGKPRTASAIADTTETAFSRAQSRLPAGAEVLERREVTAPESASLTIEAPDEGSAREMAEREARERFGKTGVVKSMSLAIPGKKGFLGMGARAGRYEVEILRQALVEVSYRAKPRISAEFGLTEVPFGCPVCNEKVPLEDAPVNLCPNTSHAQNAVSFRTSLGTRGGMIGWRQTFADGTYSEGDIGACPECHTELAFYTRYTPRGNFASRVCRRCGHGEGVEYRDE